MGRAGKSALGYNTKTFIKYCYSSKDGFINIEEASEVLHITRRRLVDIVIVLESIGVLHKVEMKRYQLLGLDNLRLNPDSNTLKLTNTVRLGMLACIFFNHLIRNGSVRTIEEILSHMGKREHQKMHRRLYDVINIFEGAGILKRQWKHIESCVEYSPPSPVFVYQLPPEILAGF
jgi:hypothetical protein